VSARSKTERFHSLHPAPPSASLVTLPVPGRIGAVRMIRQAISPRLAMKRDWIIQRATSKNLVSRIGFL
jgi:hypothetical protein